MTTDGAEALALPEEEYSSLEDVPAPAPAKRLPKALVPRPPRRWCHWTAQEDDRVRMAWGIHPVAQIARELGRTPRATYRRAIDLGLGVGAPQGFEYVTGAAARAGYDHDALMRILRWANVHIRPAASHPDFTTRNKIVEPSDVDAAIAKWCATETLQWASERHGLSWPVLRRILVSAAERGVITLDARAKTRQWRVSAADVDAAVASHRTRETWEGAARRVGVSSNTLIAWMSAAGLRSSRAAKWWPVDSRDVDRVVTEKRAAGSRAFRDTKTTTPTEGDA